MLGCRKPISKIRGPYESTKTLTCTNILRGCISFAISTLDSCRNYLKPDLFLFDDEIAQFGHPTGQRGCESSIELIRTFPVSGALSNLKFYQEFTSNFFTLSQHLGTIDLGSNDS